MFKAFEDGQLPTRGTKFSACVDLYAREAITIGAGETKLIPLGACIDIYKLYSELTEVGVDDSTMLIKKVTEFKSKHYLQLMLRSSLSKHLVIANGVGVIDLDYKDEIMVRVHNSIQYVDSFDNTIGNKVKIKKGDRVAQVTLLEHKSYLFGIDTEDERTGGFGSTDS